MNLVRMIQHYNPHEKHYYNQTLVDTKALFKGIWFERGWCWRVLQLCSGILHNFKRNKVLFCRTYFVSFITKLVFLSKQKSIICRLTWSYWSFYAIIMNFTESISLKISFLWLQCAWLDKLSKNRMKSLNFAITSWKIASAWMCLPYVEFIE